MLIDFKDSQLQKFIQIATQIEQAPHLYLDFESVSDFYKAPWLNDFPKGTEWATSGLDDGADEFDAVIYYASATLNISCGKTVSVRLVLVH